MRPSHNEVRRLRLSAVPMSSTLSRKRRRDRCARPSYTRRRKLGHKPEAPAPGLPALALSGLCRERTRRVFPRWRFGLVSRSACAGSSLACALGLWQTGPHPDIHIGYRHRYARVHLADFVLDFAGSTFDNGDPPCDYFLERTAIGVARRNRFPAACYAHTRIARSPFVIGSSE